MNLKKCDGCIVRIEDQLGNIFEGICMYNSIDYNEHEFGRSEESLQMVCYLFYKDDIKELTILGKEDEINCFSDKYSFLEEDAFESGFDIIDEFFYSEEEEHVYRMLLCLEDKLSSKHPDFEKIIKRLKELLKYNTNEKVIKETKKLLTIFVKK